MIDDNTEFDGCEDEDHNEKDAEKYDRLSAEREALQEAYQSIIGDMLHDLYASIRDNNHPRPQERFEHELASLREALDLAALAIEEL